MNTDKPDCDIKKLEKKKSLLELQSIIHGAIERYEEAISRYARMNNALTGREGCMEEKDGVEDTPNGLIYEVINDAERLRNLCNYFDEENNRLNLVIIDG